jgi:hypothetical protein
VAAIGTWLVYPRTDVGSHVAADCIVRLFGITNRCYTRIRVVHFCNRMVRLVQSPHANRSPWHLCPKSPLFRSITPLPKNVSMVSLACSPKVILRNTLKSKLRFIQQLTRTCFSNPFRSRISFNPLFDEVWRFSFSPIKTSSSALVYRVMSLRSWRRSE